MSEARRKIGGLVVIGDEVLGRRVDDRNTAAVLDGFVRHGIRAGEVAIVPDDEARIAAVVRDFADRFDVVLTTGGVGPTHDDCTWRAVGRALGDPVVLRQDVLAFMERRSGRALSPEQQRMAMLPSGTVIERIGDGWALRLGDVWVLPGVPSMVAGKLDGILARYAMAPRVLCEVYFGVDEWDVVALVDGVVAAHPGLAIGSYPIFDPAEDHRLRISLEGELREEVEAGVSAVRAALGEPAFVRLRWR